MMIKVYKKQIKRREKIRKQKGITLIELVITIIVLLIFAAVSISAIMGDDGLLSRAKSASQQTEITTEKE